MDNQTSLRKEDAALLAILPADKRAVAVASLDALLDGHSIALDALPPSLGDVATAVLDAAGMVEPEYTPGDGTDHEHGFEEFNAYHEKHHQLVGMLPNAAVTYARNAEAFLAHLIRTVGAQPE